MASYITPLWHQVDHRLDTIDLTVPPIDDFITVSCLTGQRSFQMACPGLLDKSARPIIHGFHTERLLEERFCSSMSSYMRQQRRSLFRPDLPPDRPPDLPARATLVAASNTSRTPANVVFKKEANFTKNTYMLEL
jgi:hypothetical protein